MRREDLGGSASRGRAELLLLAVSLLWGLTFPLVKGALDHAGPFAFLALRFPIGLAILWPLLGLRLPARAAWAPGLVLAALMFVSYALQTVGLVYTTSTRSAFITGLGVLFTPLLYLLRTGRRPGWTPAAGALLALVGLYLLTGPAAGGMNRGDLLTLGTAFAYALYMVELESMSRAHGYTDLLLVQFLVLPAAFLPLALLEGNPLHAEWDLAVALLVTGAILALTLYLQGRYQRDTTAPKAAVIFAGEPAFAAGFSYLLLGETLDRRQWEGAALMLAGMVLAVLPARRIAAGVDPRRRRG